MVFDELRALSATCMPVDLERFAALKERVTEVVHDILRGSLQKTQDMVSTLIKLELAHINTNHPDFIGGARAVAQLNEPPPQEAPQPPRLAAGAAAASLPTDPASLLRRTIPDGTRIVLVSCNGALVTAPPDGRGAVSATAMAPSPSTCFVVRWLLDGETSGLYRLGLQSGATGKWLSCNPASMFASSVLKVDACVLEQRIHSFCLLLLLLLLLFFFFFFSLHTLFHINTETYVYFSILYNHYVQLSLETRPASPSPSM